jgi:acyl CoA:acetate/3-ketoacid CoA transferase alpha subunit
MARWFMASGVCIAAVMPMVKSGVKDLGNIALKSGADFVGDGCARKNVKEASKARACQRCE